MKRSHLLWAVAVVALVMVLGGCGKKVQQAAEVARVAADAQDGKFTVKGEDGQTVKVEANAEGEEGGKWSMSSDKGSMTAESGKDTVTEADVGLAFYPGAEVETGVAMSGTGESAGEMKSVVLMTDDPVDKVAKFYKDKYAKGNQVVEHPEGVMIMMTEGEDSGKMIMIARDKDKAKTTIALQASASPQ